MVQTRLGGFHSANLLLRSIDYHDGWDEIPILLKAALRDLDSRGPDCILICNNTLHKAYDLIASSLDLQVPVIHIVEAVGRAASERGFKRLLLSGTKFTMEDGFYADLASEPVLSLPALPVPSLSRGVHRMGRRTRPELVEGPVCQSISE
jgi:aspartate racemase